MATPPSRGCAKPEHRESMSAAPKSSSHASWGFARPRPRCGLGRGSRVGCPAQALTDLDDTKRPPAIRKTALMGAAGR